MKKFIVLMAVIFSCPIFNLIGQEENLQTAGNSIKKFVPDHIRERKAFKRAEYFFNQRAYPFDTVPIFHYSQEMTKEIEKVKTTPDKDNSDLSWSSLGPKGVNFDPASNWGVVSGRVRTIAVHPTDPQTVYVGAASGGLWKTTDGGQYWQDIGHDLQSLSFGAIAIDPNNPQIIYAGSGESSLLENFNIYPGHGLYKSTDGGATWMVITDGFGAVTHFGDLAIHPANSNILLAALGGATVFGGVTYSNEGVWKSTNGGITWNKILDVPDAADIAFHPTNPDIYYAAAGGYLSPLKGFYISDDQGITWEQSNTGLILPPLGGRMQFDIAQSNPNIIYSVVFHMNMNPTVGPTSAYKSIDGGQNWTHISTATPLGGNYGYGWIDQGWYDLCIAVDPVDPDHVLIGNIELHRTTNGSTFTPVRPYGNSAWGSLAHVDYHTLVFAPSNPNILYIGCDGGVYKSTDKGYTATPQNDGLETMQFYRITSHPFNPDFLIGGMQDNGTAMTTDGGLTWNFITGGDGMECLINPNPDTIYTSSQNGLFYRSINGGASFSIMYNANGGWVTPLIMHPSDNKVLYTANKRIWKSVNGGNSFQLISGSANLVSQNITSMAQSPVNPSNMILGTGMDHPHFDSVFVVKISIDEGATWSDVSQNIPGEERWIARVLCDPLDANTMFVLRTGFSPENKVWKTTDLGLTWTNISGDLPDLPCNDLFIDPENTSHLYVANDIGVYRSTDWGSTWTYASQGIPFVPAIDLDYSRIGNNRYLRVGTHGRSIYQTLLPNYCLPEGIIFTTQAQIDSFQVNYPGCATITGDVKIAGGDISNLSGLNGITAMEGELRIGGVAGNSNANLLSLIGLGNLNYTGWLKVTNSTALASLNGLEGLAGIGNDMIIGSNGVLTNIEGISNVVSIGGNLNISNNTSLSTCEVQSICDYLAAPNGTIEIYNNAPGCNSSEEVEEACETTDIKSFTNQDACLVIPNPVTEKLTLYCSGLLGNIELIEIYNTFGAKVEACRLSQTDAEITLDVTDLPPGLYFLRLQAGNEVRTGKVIKH